MTMPPAAMPESDIIPKALENEKISKVGFAIIPATRSPRTGESKQPVLIIPGFMSSGLRVEQSSLHPPWQGQRIWLNLKSIGFQSLHRGGALVKNEQSRRIILAEDEEAADGSPVGSRGGSGLGDQDIPSYSEEMHLEYLKQAKCKSRWVEHMRLGPDMVKEKEGLRIRPIPGTAGVDYLTPGALTESVSYVFGPVLKLLKSVGYQEGVDLDAAPYDWRIPPSELQSRDNYFTNTMQKIEFLYHQTNGKPVVLLCHSLGCKTAHYLMNFALNYPGAGQIWLNRYVHSYVPVGAPHIGAPKSIRAMVDGDKMGLEAFLDDYEGLVLGRSFGSGPWLFPTGRQTLSFDQLSTTSQILPMQTSTAPILPSTSLPIACCSPSLPMITLRREGTLRITLPSNQLLISSLLDPDRESPPAKLRVALEIGSVTLRTNFQPVSRKRGHAHASSLFVNFPQETFVVACPPDLSQTSMIFQQCQLHLEEPGVGSPQKRKETHKNEEKRNQTFFEYIICFPLKVCSCILKWFFCCSCIIFFRGSKWLMKSALAGAEAGAKAMGSTWRLAHSDVVNLKNHFVSIGDGNSGLGKSFSVRFILEPNDDFRHELFKSRRLPNGVLIKFQWEPPVMDSFGVNVPSTPDSIKSKTSVSFPDVSSERYICHESIDDVTYLPSGVHQLLHMENLTNALQLLHTHYTMDPLKPHSLSSYHPPPVHKVIAIYGINLPTEIGAVYRRNPWLRISSTKTPQLFVLDKEAKLSGECEHLFELNKGLICETSSTPQTLPRLLPDYSDNNHQRSNDAPNGNNDQLKSSISNYVTVQRSGDGTVPYWSLQQCRYWQDQGPAKCDVTVYEIEGSEHRSILNDARFHEILLELLGCSRISLASEY